MSFLVLKIFLFFTFFKIYLWGNMKQDKKVSPGKKDAGSKGGGAGLYIYKGFYLLVFRFSFRCSFKKVVPNKKKRYLKN